MSSSVPSVIRRPGDTRSRSIWQWQLVLAFTTVTIAAGVALLTPGMLTDWRFSAGLVLVVAMTIATISVPWHRVRASGIIAVPLADTVAIGLLDAGSEPPVSFLWVFPVAWVASYYSTLVLVGTLGLVSAFSLMILFEVGITPEHTIGVVVLLITLGFVGIIMSVGSQRNRATRRLLQGQSQRIGTALRRVTDQKERNRRLIDSLDLGIARVGPGGLNEVANRAFRRIYGLDETAIFHPTRAVEYRARRGDPVPLAETTIARASRGELFADEFVWLFGIDGQWRALKTSTRVIDDGHVATDGVLLLVEDVTEAVDPTASEEATRRSISHELRNPLTAVLGHLDLLLERDEFSPSARAQLEVVERAGSRMQRLIDDALSASPRACEETYVEFDLAGVARASIEGFSPVANSQGVSLEVRLEQDLPLIGDAFRLRQVVDNVLGNAIKYAQRGGRVSVQTARPNRGEVALVVSDTGIGISAEDLPRIFEPEFRTDLAREQGIPGTGLGLDISHRIVVEHGGRLDVTSELGQGTEVSIVLPVEPERILL